MKNIFIVIILFISRILIANEIYYTPTISVLRFRMDSTTNSKEIRKLNKGEKLLLLEKGKSEIINNVKGNWIKVQTENNEIGWCFDAYLELLYYYKINDEDNQIWLFNNKNEKIKEITDFPVYNFIVSPDINYIACTVIYGYRGRSGNYTDDSEIPSIVVFGIRIVDLNDIGRGDIYVHDGDIIGITKWASDTKLIYCRSHDFGFDGYQEFDIKNETIDLFSFSYYDEDSKLKNLKPNYLVEKYNVDFIGKDYFIYENDLKLNQQ